MDNESYYDEFADWYERDRHRGYHRMLDDLEVETVKRYGAGTDVLEAGCGTGLILHRTAEFARSAVGIDLSSGMLKRARERGLDVVRRRSGGSSVVLVPGAHVWIDVWVPAGDPLWADDVAAAAVPVGEAWVAALARSGWTGLTVHRAGSESAPWSDLVCFAGRGPGEVITADGRKLVGLSQRRTRDWIRLQCLVHRRWSAVEAVAALALGADDRAAAEFALREAVAAVGAIDESGLVAGLITALH